MYVNDTSINLPKVNLIEIILKKTKAQPSELVIGQKKIPHLFMPQIV